MTLPDDVKGFVEFHIDLTVIAGEYWERLENNARNFIKEGKITVITGGKQNEAILPGIVILPSCVDTSVYVPAEKIPKKVVWIGKPSSHKRIMEAGEIARNLIPYGYTFTFFLGQMMGNNVRQFNTEFNDLINTPEFHVVVGAQKERVIKELSEATYFLATYEHDCCSVAVLEAMSCGCITVTTKAGTLMDMVGASGLTIPNKGDIVGNMTHAIMLLEDRDDKEARSRLARDYVVKNHDIRNYIKKHIELYTGWEQ